MKKSNTWKKMTRTVLSLLLVASIFTGLGFSCSSAYAMNEGEETVEEAVQTVTAVENVPVVESTPAVESDPVVETVYAVESTPAVESVPEQAEVKAEEAAPAEKAEAEIKEEVKAEVQDEVKSEAVEEAVDEIVEEVVEEVPAVEKMAVMMMTAPAADENINETAPAAKQNEEADISEETEEAASNAEAEITEEAEVTPAPKYVYYNNGNHDIAIEVYEDGKMVCKVNNTEATGEDLAIVQLHDSEGNVINGSLKDELKEMVTNITLGEGILGVGWSSYSYYETPEKTDVFHGFEKLTEVNPSSTLEVIGWSAFRKCFNLVNFDFSKCANLTTVMRQAFSNTAIKSADFSNTQVETIGHGAFENCTSLEEVSIPSTVTSIYDQAFYKCSGIQEIEYNAAAYETSIQENGKENPYFASAIFSASKNNDYTLTIGSDVEVLPRGFFKAFLGAGEISFSATEDNDDCTVSGRSLSVDKDATFNQSPAPFKNLTTDCVVDENGVLYEKKSDTLQITYFSPELSQYTLPRNVQVSEEAIAVADLGDYASSKVAGTVTFKIEASDELAGIDAAELPDFKISDTVLVLKNKDGSSSFKPFSAADLTGNASYSVTVENEDGSRTEYSFSLSGWAMEDGTVLSLDEVISLNGEVSLTSVWDMVKEEIPAPAPEKQDEADEDKADETPAADEEIKADTGIQNIVNVVPVAAPIAAAAAVQEAVIAQNVEEVNDTAVPMAKPVVADIAYSATPLSAVHAGAVGEAPETVENHGNLILFIVLILAVIAMMYVIIRNREEENA